MERIRRKRKKEQKEKTGTSNGDGKKAGVQEKIPKKLKKHETPGEKGETTWGMVKRVGVGGGNKFGD